MYALVQNLRFAFRQLRKAPGFTLTVVPLNKGRGWAHRVPRDCERCGVTVSRAC